jgi:hypothetical protein
MRHGTGVDQRAGVHVGDSGGGPMQTAMSPTVASSGLIQGGKSSAERSHTSPGDVSTMTTQPITAIPDRASKGGQDSSSALEVSANV